MDKHTDAGRDPTGGAQREPLGTLGEEAVKLLTQAAAWASGQQSRVPPQGAGPDEPCPSCGSTAPDAACTWCPICQAAAFLRSTNPELSDAVHSTVVSMNDLVRTVLDSWAQLQHQHRPHRGSQEQGGDGWG